MDIVWIAIALILVLLLLLGVLNQLGRLAVAVEALNRKEARMAGELDQLEADVTGISNAVDASIALMQGLKAKLDEAIASGDMSRVVAVNAELEAKTQALAAAVVANTPAAPAAG